MPMWARSGAAACPCTGGWRGRINTWRDNSINALFPVLPVSGFTVQGATAPADALLLASGAEYRFGNGLSLRGKLEAELANSATTFAASAMFRASW